MVLGSMLAIKRYALQRALSALSGRIEAAITVAVWLVPKALLQLLSQRVVARTHDHQSIELKVRAAILDEFSKVETPDIVHDA